MNSTELMIKYKHDIIGQFRDLKDAIESLEPADFESAEKLEVFHAVHEVLLKMVRTSRNTISKKLNHEIVLVRTNGEPDLNLTKLQIEGISVRFSEDNTHIKYIYSKAENKGNLDLNLEILRTILPINSIIHE